MIDFSYDAEQWLRVVATLPAWVDQDGQDEIKREIERSAYLYLYVREHPEDVEPTREKRESAKRVRRALVAALETLSEEPTIVSAGELSDIRKSMRKVGLRAIDIESTPRQNAKVKANRSGFIERLIRVWWSNCMEAPSSIRKLKPGGVWEARRGPLRDRPPHFDELPPTEVSRLLDFLEAATRPVLTGGDAFGTEVDSGRDALGKAVDAIKSRGFQHKFLQWDLIRRDTL